MFSSNCDAFDKREQHVVPDNFGTQSLQNSYLMPL